jgi:hypothetical protein
MGSDDEVRDLKVLINTKFYTSLLLDETKLYK